MECLRRTLHAYVPRTNDLVSECGANIGVALIPRILNESLVIEKVLCCITGSCLQIHKQVVASRETWKCLKGRKSKDDKMTVTVDYQRKLKYFKLAVMINGSVMITGKWRSFKITLPIMHLFVNSREASDSYSTHIDDSTKSKEKNVMAEPATKITFGTCVCKMI